MLEDIQHLPFGRVRREERVAGEGEVASGFPTAELCVALPGFADPPRVLQPYMAH